MVKRAVVSVVLRLGVIKFSLRPLRHLRHLVSVVLRLGVIKFSLRPVSNVKLFLGQT